MRPFSLLLLVLFCACDKKAEEAAPVASASASAVAHVAPQGPSRPTPSASTSAGAVSNGGMGDVGAVFGQLPIEAAHRPAITPNADQAFAALEKAGFPIVERQQSLGSTYKAAYCSHGLTSTKDVAVLICEYADPAATAIGLTTSNAMLATMTRRKSWAHKSLVMATMPQDPASPPAALAQIAKLVAVFNGL